MRAFSIILLLLSFSTITLAQKDKQAYQIYNSKGKKVTFKKAFKQLSKADIILFGEFHNNPISHWLQLEVTQDLHQQKALILGAEMLEADNQDVLDLYLKDSIDAKGLDTLARLWPNHKTDYAPLVNFAKKHQLPFIATNIPRRYASMVFKKGIESLDTLPALEKSWITPLPMAYDANLPKYKAMLKMMGGHGGENFPKAQAIKDATMAHFILKHWTVGKCFLHYNGAYHSDDYEGILWHLKQKEPTLNYITISTVEQSNVQSLEKEFLNRADFIICVPKTMTKTY